MHRDEPFVLLRDDLADRTLVFAEPQRRVIARDAGSFFEGLATLESARRDGKWIAGFMAYEAGYLFEPKLAPHVPQGRQTPLMAFGIFDAPTDDLPLAIPRQRTENEPLLSHPRAGWNFAEYSQRFDRLHRHIRQGDCYQANLTMPIHAGWNGDPVAAFWSSASRCITARWSISADR